MAPFFEIIAEQSEALISMGWLPLLIWTAIAFVVWMALRVSGNMHPEYHYHARIGLIFALPAGFILLAAADFLTGFIYSGSAESGVKFISVMAPFEIGTMSSETSTTSTIFTFYTGLILLYVTGVIVSLGRFLSQWLHLYRLRRSCQFQDIQDIEEIQPTNRGLALSIQKPIQVAFLSTDFIPVTFGVVSPVILLPNSLNKNPDKLNIALRHELTHISKHDFFAHLLVIAVESLFWFHPLVHRFKKELIEYRELRCDAFVLDKDSVSKKEYASLLLELIPMPNINQELSVNMAQESTNLKKRISMITQNDTGKPIPTRSSLSILCAIFLCTAIAMACTDMQTQNVFDEEELDLMTDFDSSGERNYQQILIYMGDNEQADRHEDALENLNRLQPEFIRSISVLKGEDAVQEYGSRASEGIIVVRTKRDIDSYNTTLKALGMEAIAPPPPLPEGENRKLDDEDYFVVVEEMPKLIGGLMSIQQHITYPEEARNAGIEGRVYIQFIVTEEGKVDNPRVIRGIGGGADEVALEAIKKAEFEPGYQRGRPVRVQYSIPIVFKLQQDESEG